MENFLSAELAKDNSITNCTLVFKHRIYKFTNSTFALPVKATGGGGLRAQNHVVLIWTISLNCERCWRPHQKILLQAHVMTFWKSRFACNYSMCKNLKSGYPKIAFMYLLNKNHPSRRSEAWFIPSLGEYLQIYFLLILWAKNCPKMAAILDFWAYRA